MTWIPNLLTASRLVLLLPIMALLAGEAGPVAHWWAFGLFLLASVTDWLDGWAARRLGCASNIGIFFDPLADKVFANVLLIFLACRYPSWVPLWVVLSLLAREFAVQGFRSMTPCLGVVISTGLASKLKLVFQLVAAGTALVGLAWDPGGPVLLGATWVALMLAIITGFWSMFTLFRDNADLWGRPPVKMERR